MKTLALLLCLFYSHVIVAQATVESFAEKIDFSVENVTICTERSGVTVEELEDVEKQALENGEKNVSEDMKKIGCFWACLMQQQGAMTGSTINGDQMTKYIRKFGEKYGDEDINSDLDKLVEDCANSVKDIDDECQAIMSFHMCTANSRSP
ncbi:uncharacterized protein LOC122395844 [Colletes gigas]|uniref:uncharacterized protein LOC122395844 n=1 Tax=Colletes gigas TaxID=935657 RepID=UPI001C9A6155|nr:uncharacterized protein LOC122395844 [Colletes gigas]